MSETTINIRITQESKFITIKVNNIVRDNAFVKTKKKVRKRGKVEKIYGTDKPKIAQGASVRGQLHKETFLGCIKTEKGEKFVKRIPLDTITESNVKDIVDEALRNEIEKKLSYDDKLADIIKNGILRKDKNGNLTRVRHIRIYVRNNNPLKLKKQLQLHNSSKPNREYKQFYYTENEANYCCAFYEGIKKGKTERAIRCYSLFDYAKNRNSIFDKLEVKGSYLALKYILKYGQKVIFYEKEPQELNSLSLKELSNRMYRIVGFYKDDNNNVIKLVHHKNAMEPDKALKEQGVKEYTSSKVNFEKKPFHKLSIVPNNCNFIVERDDFEIKRDGKIIFK
jgi:CRISPR-associated endonuclease Csn1